MLAPCDLKEVITIMLSKVFIPGLEKEDPSTQQLHDIRLLELFSPQCNLPTYAVSLNGANPGVIHLIHCASKEDALHLFEWFRKCTIIEHESNPPVRREHFGVFQNY